MDLTTFNPAIPEGDGEAKFQIAGNIFVKMFTLDAPGKKIHGHAHTFDHVTLLATGSVIKRAGGLEERFKAPHLFITPANVEHEFECIEPAILCCTHAIRQSDFEHDVADPLITPLQGLEFMSKFPLVGTKE